MTAPDERDTTTVDISGLARASGPAALAAMLARSVALYLGLFALSMIWLVVILVGFNQAGDAALLVAAPIAFAPFIYGAYRVVIGAERWTAGVGSFLSAKDLEAGELTRTVPHVGVSVEALLDRVNAFAAGLGTPRVVRETNAAKISQAWGLRLGATGLLFAGVVAGVSTGSAGSPNYLPPVLAFVVFSYLFLKARKLLQPSLETVLAQDRRKPVLLLRSFQDEMLKADQYFSTPIGSISLHRRFEQGIAGSFTAFGPLIAIGKPGEELPQIGAARIYLGDAEWQAAVLRWMDASVMIAMIAGATEWIRWELHRIVEMGRASRLLILLPPQADKARWDNVVAALAGTPWGAPLGALDIKGLLLVMLRPEGRVVAIRRHGGRPFIQDYQLAIAIAVHEEFLAAGGPQPS